VSVAQQLTSEMIVDSTCHLKCFHTIIFAGFSLLTLKTTMFSSNLTRSPVWSLITANPRKAGLALFAGLLLVHRFITVAYRLLFSPIAKFPGPKLAAASGLYELYFNFFRNGKYVFEIARLHRIYGMSVPLSCSESLMS
jgi:hypothetical protein